MEKKNKIEERIKFLNGVEDFRKNKVKILSYTVSGDKIELSIIMDGEKISGTNNIKDFLNPKRSKYGCRVIGDFICGKKKEMTEDDFFDYVKKHRADDWHLFEYSDFKKKDNKLYVKVTCKKCGASREMRYDAFGKQKQNPKGCCSSKEKKVSSKVMDVDKWEKEVNELGFRSKNNTGVKKVTDKLLFVCEKHKKEFESSYYDLRTGRKKGCELCCSTKKTKAYKLSLLIGDDIQKSPTDSRFFCLSGMEIFALIKSGILPSDFLSLAKTPRFSKDRFDSIKTLIEKYTSSEEDDKEETGEEDIVDVIDVETIDEITKSDDDDTCEPVTDEETGLPIIKSRSETLMDGDIPGIDELDYSEENGRFIVEKTIQKWWCAVSDDIDVVDKIREYRGSKFYDYIKSEFFKEYDSVMAMKNPKGYSLSFELYPYQKLLAYKLKNNDSYSLWLGPGGGKTYSCLYASRQNGLKNNLVIAPKSVLQESWLTPIYDIFPDTNVITFFCDDICSFKVDGNKEFNKWVDEHVTMVENIDKFSELNGDYNYILVNYDKFSQPNTKKFIENISKKYKIDYVSLDETQKVKYRESSGEASKRNQNVLYLLSIIRECNPDLKISALTGTPLINEISEVKSIIEIVTGDETNNIIGNRVNINNVYEAHKSLILNGFRYIPEINVKYSINTRRIECDDELKSKIIELSKKESYYSELESELALAKINSPEVIDEIKKGVILYIIYPYKNNTGYKIVKKLEELGLKVGSYFGCTPNKHEVFDDFVNENTDVLVASSPISVGVDGLQNRSDKMIILSLPQTNADFEQLIKRIVRRRKAGSKLGDKGVSIIIPQIVLTLNEEDEHGYKKEWSWDKSRMNGILYKKSIGDAVMDGDVQKVFNINWNKLYENAMDVIREGVDDELEVTRKKITIKEPESLMIDTKKAISIISETHRMVNTSKHETTHKFFEDNPDAFIEYHKAREISKTSWPEDPVDYVAQFINEHYKNKNIADLGCGLNKLSTLMKNGNIVKGFDHQRVDGCEDVIISDMANLTDVVEDKEMDIAVFCLSLWGCNYEDYFKEAFRILKDDGRLIIVEPSSDFGEGKHYGSETEFTKTLQKYGFYTIGSIEKRNNFTYFRFLKE